MVQLLGLVAMCSGCLGDGGAVNVRWRVGERETGRLDDPRDIADGDGVCCQKLIGGQCTSDSGWEIHRVELQLQDPATDEVRYPDLTGLAATCGSREFTTPFNVPSGTYAITLVAYNPLDTANPNCTEAQSPLPEIRNVKSAEIVQLDVVELSVSATQGDLCPSGG